LGCTSSIPESSPIYQAFGSSEEKLHKEVKLDFGSLRGRRNLIVKAISQAILTIVLPVEIDPDMILNRHTPKPLSEMARYYINLIK